MTFISGRTHMKYQALYSLTIKKINKYNKIKKNNKIKKIKIKSCAWRYPLSVCFLTFDILQCSCALLVN